MKICMATLRPEIKLAGETKSFFNLYNQLNKSLNVDIVTYKGKNLKQFRGSDLKVSNDMGLFDFFRIFKFLKKINFYCKDYDIIQLHLPTPIFSFIGDIVKILTGSKVIVFFESNLINNKKEVIKSLTNDFSFYLLRLLLNNKIIARLCFKKADAYIVATNYQKKILENLGYKNIIVIPNLIDDNIKFKIKKKRGEIITYIGHFIDIKGIYLLLDNFYILKREFSNLKLVLAYSGIGNKNKILKKVKRLGLKDEVIFYNEINVYKLLSESNCFVLPYKFTFGTNMIPNLIFDCLLVGCPLLTSNLRPLNEILENGKTAVLFNPYLKYDLYKKLKLLLTSKNLQKRIIREQHKLIKTEFNTNILVDKYLNLYKGLI